MLAATAGCATARSGQTAQRKDVTQAASVPERERSGASAADERWETTERRPGGAGGEAGALQPVLVAARASVGQERPEIDGKPAPHDCALFIGALFATAGVDLFSEARRSDGGVRAIYRYVRRRGRLRFRGPPSPGDLVFFDNSYDRNRDGRLNDRLTHVGIVDEVRPDGTAFVIHSTNHGIAREPMNLLHPHQIADQDDHRINSVLRRKRAREPVRLAHLHLMSELFAGFGTVTPPPLAAAACPGGNAKPACRAAVRQGRSVRRRRGGAPRSDQSSSSPR